MKKAGYDESLELIRELYPGRAMLSVRECAGLLGMSEKSIYEIGKRSKKPLPIKKFGGKVLIPVSGLASWMSS